MFTNALKQTLLEDFNESRTANGALGYRTTGKNLLDLNFAVASLRSASEETIVQKFALAFHEDSLLALKWLFYARDVREGLGERRLFRVAFDYLAKNDVKCFNRLIPLVAEYGRWDDLWILLDTKYSEVVVDLVISQIASDKDNMREGYPISLLAKWMPSINASSTETKRKAKTLAGSMNLTDASYRKLLSALRKYLDVVETKMSSKKWSEINYRTVPSRANLIYRDAFLRNDEERRREFLGKLAKGETTINAGVLYPHDIVNKYHVNLYGGHSIDIALEELWKAMPDLVQGNDSTIVVADGSGSMRCSISRSSSATALDVANALAIYFAERCQGQFKDKYITFSEHPQLVDLSGSANLKSKIEIALRHSEIANTNIEAVFKLILKTAINAKLTQDELPKNILIISDMEFDQCADNADERIFAALDKEFQTAGYQLPRLVFWNVTSHTNTIPVRENKLGVALVSGFSTNIVKMVMSSELDPFKCLLEAINVERYDAIEAAFKE